MATTPALIPLDRYLHTRYKPDRDYVDGVLESRRTLWPKTQEDLSGEHQHNRIQATLAAWFINHEHLWPILTVTEQRIKVAPTRVRICDLCLVRPEHRDEQVTLTPPLLCIEILSPEDRLSRARKVLEDYRQMGVQQSWLIDPATRIAYTYTTILQQATTDRLELPGTPIHLILSDLFRALD